MSLRPGHAPQTRIRKEFRPGILSILLILSHAFLCRCAASFARSTLLPTHGLPASEITARICHATKHDRG